MINFLCYFLNKFLFSTNHKKCEKKNPCTRYKNSSINPPNITFICINDSPNTINPIQNNLFISLFGIYNYLLLKNLIVEIIPALINKIKHIKI